MLALEHVFVAEEKVKSFRSLLSTVTKVYILNSDNLSLILRTNRLVALLVRLPATLYYDWQAEHLQAEEAHDQRASAQEADEKEAHHDQAGAAVDEGEHVQGLVAVVARVGLKAGLPHPEHHDAVDEVEGHDGKGQEGEEQLERVFEEVLHAALIFLFALQVLTHTTCPPRHYHCHHFGHLNHFTADNVHQQTHAVS